MPGTVYRAGPRLQGGVEPRRRLSKYLKAIMTNAHHNVAARRDVVGPRSDLSGGIGIETVEVRSEPPEDMQRVIETMWAEVWREPLRRWLKRPLAPEAGEAGE